MYLKNWFASNYKYFVTLKNKILWIYIRTVATVFVNFRIIDLICEILF